MANAHGHLPKADPAQLSPELRRRLDVWFDKAYRDDNLFLTLAREPAVLELFLGWVSLVYTDRSRIDPKVVELLTAEDVDAALGDLDAATTLPPATVAALSVASAGSFIEAFGIRPDGWTEATPPPWGRSAVSP